MSPPDSAHTAHTAAHAAPPPAPAHTAPPRAPVPLDATISSHDGHQRVFFTSLPVNVSHCSRMCAQRRTASRNSSDSEASHPGLHLRLLGTVLRGGGGQQVLTRLAVFWVAMASFGRSFRIVFSLCSVLLTMALMATLSSNRFPCWSAPRFLSGSLRKISRKPVRSAEREFNSWICRKGIQ